MRIIDVTLKNVADTGVFCKMSQQKTAGYQRKLSWLRARFAEGMRMKLLDLAEGGRGFIEYIPGEYAWRAVSAPDYLFIHCLWVVGSSKGKGYGSLLLEQCVTDAKRERRRGVAMLTSEGNWLIGKEFLLDHGFISAGRAPPSFELMVKRFGRAPLPSVPDDWDARANRCGTGLTIFRTDQCPYLDDAVGSATEAAHECGLAVKVVEMQTAREIRELAPSAYGTFSLVLDGQLVSYHPTPKKALLEIFSRDRGG